VKFHLGRRWSCPGPEHQKDTRTASPDRPPVDKAASKTKYTCPGCGLNAWAKPEVNLVCGDCGETMEPETADAEEEAD
jgi:transcription elongation factor Elf1